MPDKAIHSLKNWGQGCPTYEFTCDYRRCMISLEFGRTSYTLHIEEQNELRSFNQQYQIT